MIFMFLKSLGQWSPLLTLKIKRQAERTQKTKKEEISEPKIKNGKTKKASKKVPVRVEFEGLDIDPDVNKVKLEEDDIQKFQER